MKDKDCKCRVVASLPQGPQGPQGPMGVQGATGSSGMSDPQSAFRAQANAPQQITVINTEVSLNFNNQLFI
ncbi:hypothetical protein [Cytobacillus sp. IB215316]|uniref:hypothetical protein n=1 Tax=Cytobacillus sp. IB215316 TaxID=3097354 RepID=UPI002A149921|nr:hypothetical protein [Cytobacillus sp. IB215316]MDX8361736.1 hypothetical protein [Cytobacillus sp. IB215316]